MKRGGGWVLKLIIGSAAILFIECYFQSGVAHALVVDRQCTDIDIIFARGSGVELGKGEAPHFRDQLLGRLKGSIETNFYELGTEPYGNYKYPAIPVTDWWKNGNAIGAGLSAGEGNDYGDSVRAGVTELKNYLQQRHAACPNARIILGGYSQGAQVMGQALPDLPADIQSKIDFVALFGDPKLYLPEGAGVSPPACHGLEYSVWRREIGDCNTDNGSLGARKPYIPGSMTDKVGLWCNAEDFVCGSTKNVWKTDGHGKYAEVGGAIDQAAAEIARRLKTVLPPQKSLAVDDTKVGEKGTDVVFLLNRAGWDSWMQYSLARQRIEEIAQTLLEKKPGVRLSYREYIGNATTMAGFGVELKDDPTDFFKAITYPSHPVEPDSPRQPTLRALEDAFDDTEWKSGASKSVVLFTNADFFNPDVFEVTPASVARRSVEIDPVNVFAVVPENFKGSFDEVTRMTSGRTIIAGSDFFQPVNDTISAMTTRPTAKLKNAKYIAEVGEQVMFDASDSHLPGGEITKYEWDFDGDGVFDQTTTIPRISHGYSGLSTYYVQVRVTGSNGVVANTSAPVVVRMSAEPLVTMPSPPVNVTAEIVSTNDRKSTVLLSWEPYSRPACDEACGYTDVAVESWAVSMNGVVLGKLDTTKRSIQIEGIDRNTETELGVASLSPGGYLSERTSATIEKLPLDKVSVPAPGRLATPTDSPLSARGSYSEDTSSRKTSARLSYETLLIGSDSARGGQDSSQSVATPQILGEQTVYPTAHMKQSKGSKSLLSMGLLVMILLIFGLLSSVYKLGRLKKNKDVMSIRN